MPSRSPRPTHGARRRPPVHGLVVCLSALGLSAAELPAPSESPVDFARDIQPILETSCLRCHGPERARSGYRLDTREHALGMGDNNDANLIPGDSAHSPLIRYVAGLEPDMQMPPAGQGDPLTPEQVALLRRWVDDGAVWDAGSIARQAEATYEATVGLRWIGVEGNQARFREHWWRNDGWAGGIEHFELTQPLGEGETLSAEGHAIPGQESYRVALELRKVETGFVRGGFEVARKWYDDLGGWYEPFAAEPPALGRDLFVDAGRAWIEAGLRRSHLPEVVAGYEYRFRDGARSILQWGQWSPTTGGATTKAVYPAALDLAESTHTVKLDVSHEIGGYRIEDEFRTEFYDLETRRQNVGSGGPDVTESYAEDYDHTRIANALRAEKQLRDWLFASAGYLYANLDGNGAFQQAFDIAGVGAFPGDRSQRIALNQDNHVGNANLRLGPWQQTTLSAGIQADWSEQTGLTDLLQPGFPDDYPAAYQSDLGRFALDERLGLRCDAVPLTVLYADARWRQEWLDYTEWGGVDDGFGDSRDFLRDTDERGDLWDVTAGFNFSPHPRVAVEPWVRHRERDRQFTQLADTDASDPTFAVPGNGYPAFFQRLGADTDEVGLRLVNRWNRWLRSTVRFELSETTYDNETPDVFVPGFPTGTFLSGGQIVSGEETAGMVTLGLVLTPWRQWRFSLSGSWRESDLSTPVTEGGLVVPYEGAGYNVLSSVTWLFDRDTDLRAAYSFSGADYEQDNFASLPLGVRYERHAVTAGLTRRLKPGVTAGLNYGFFLYHEPTSGDAADYVAHAVFTTVTFALR